MPEIEVDPVREDAYLKGLAAGRSERRRAVEEEQERNARLVEALRDIEAIQPKVLGYIRRNGFVFEDLGNEPGNWQHLAFSIYSDLCQADSIARAALQEEQEGAQH